MSIKRIGAHLPGYMYESPSGDYVLYTDHIAALEAVKATVKPLEWEKNKMGAER
jgi:hypothetical protein